MIDRKETDRDGKERQKILMIRKEERKKGRKAERKKGRKEERKKGRQRQRKTGRQR